MTLKDLQEMGVLKLMTNTRNEAVGYNVYNYENESPILNLGTDIPDNWEEIKNTWEVKIISGDPYDFIAAIYVSKPCDGGRK